MRPIHVALAVAATLAWALNFVVVAVGLKTLPPLFMLAVRFALCALPIFVLPRPTVPWPRFLAIGVNLFILQFGFLFLAMANGMSAGMASVLLQTQTIFTPIIAAVFLGERATLRQIAAISVAVLGMGVIASTIASGGITVIGVVLTLSAALFWAISNIQLRAIGQQNMLALMAWMSLLPPLPFFALSLMFEGGPHQIAHLVASAGWREVGVILYSVLISTYIGHAGWAQLLKHYKATTVAPFSLLVPIFAAVASSLLLGEQFGEMRLIGMALVLAGLAIIALPARRTPTAPVLSDTVLLERGLL